jgi:hypothetical protein
MMGLMDIMIVPSRRVTHRWLCDLKPQGHEWMQVARKAWGAVLRLWRAHRRVWTMPWLTHAAAFIIMTQMSMFRLKACG